MPRRSRVRRTVPDPPPRSNLSPFHMILMGLAAGALGAGLMWYLLGGKSEPTRTVTPSSVVAPEAPPNVAHLSPADAAVTLGNWHYDRQRWLQAIEQYQEALKLGKDNADVRTDM